MATRHDARHLADTRGKRQQTVGCCQFEKLRSVARTRRLNEQLQKEIRSAAALACAGAASKCAERALLQVADNRNARLMHGKSLPELHFCTSRNIIFTSHFAAISRSTARGLMLGHNGWAWCEGHGEVHADAWHGESLQGIGVLQATAFWCRAWCVRE
jgi:hypothetical protein